MKFQGFVGPTYKLNSVNVDCQRCVNLIPEKIESGNGKEASTIYYKSAEGLEKIAEVGDGPIRLIHMDYTGQVFVVSGTEVYTLIEIVGGVETINPNLVGNIGTNDLTPGSPQVDVTRQVKAVSLILPAPEENWTLFTDGSWTSYYYYHNADYSVTGFGQTGLLISPPYATQVEFIDGYTAYIVPNENKFYISEWNNLTTSPLSFATSEGNPDRILSMQVLDRLLYIFNEKSIEVYSNTGNADFPFERVSGGFISTGCLAEYSTARNIEAIFWLGRDENGQGTVFAMKGLTPQRISTHAIEQAISSYANPEKAVGYCYSREGHGFYVLNFAEASWCYDMATGMWHERAYTDEAGDLVRHRTNGVAFRSTQLDVTNNTYINKYFCGDYEDNRIYLLKQGHFYDDTAPLTRMRRSPHVSSGNKRVFYKRFHLDMETGVGLDGDVQGSDPQVMLRFSNDGGHTWSSEAWASAGKKIGGIGDFKKRVIWNRLGSAYDRVFEVKVSDPVDVTIIGADLEIEVGAS